MSHNPRTDEYVPWYWQAAAGLLVSPLPVAALWLPADRFWQRVLVYVYAYTLVALVCRGFRRPSEASLAASLGEGDTA